MTCLYEVGLFGAHIYVPNREVSLGRQQTGLEENHLALRTIHETSETPWQTPASIIEQGIDGANQGVVAVVYIVLIGLPTVFRRCRFHAAHSHHLAQPLS